MKLIKWLVTLINTTFVFAQSVVKGTPQNWMCSVQPLLPETIGRLTGVFLCILVSV